jgi:predicted HicB family RNase H-like nuclease
MIEMIPMNEKRITLKLDAELYKKLKIKATANDESVNGYVKTLISDNVNGVDLSALIN